MTREGTSRSHPDAPERRRRRSGAPSSGASSSHASSSRASSSRASSSRASSSRASSSRASSSRASSSRASSSHASSGHVERRRDASHDGARPRPDAIETGEERRPAGDFRKGFGQTLPIAAGLAVLIVWVGWLCAEMGSHVHGGLATLATIFAVIAGIVILTGVGAGMAALRRSR